MLGECSFNNQSLESMAKLIWPAPRVPEKGETEVFCLAEFIRLPGGGLRRDAGLPDSAYGHSRRAAPAPNSSSVPRKGK